MLFRTATLGIVSRFEQAYCIFRFARIECYFYEKLKYITNDRSLAFNNNNNRIENEKHDHARLRRLLV